MLRPYKWSAIFRRLINDTSYRPVEDTTFKSSPCQVVLTGIVFVDTITSVQLILIAIVYVIFYNDSLEKIMNVHFGMMEAFVDSMTGYKLIDYFWLLFLMTHTYIYANTVHELGTHQMSKKS